VAAPAPARRSVQGLVVPGRRRVHMHNEHARRRRAIVAAVVAMGVEAGGVEATVYDAAHRYHSDLAARGACLGALVEDLAGSGDDIDLVIEADASLVRSDRHEPEATSGHERPRPPLVRSPGPDETPLPGHCWSW